MALPNIGATTSQELIGKHVACIGIAHAHRLTSEDAIGKAAALIDVEDSVLA